MNMNPYVGITDFTSFEQVTKMLEVFRRHKSSRSQRVLHVGVMMSFKTLNGIETKWSKAFPPKDTIANIFHGSDDDVYNCLHCADHTGTKVDQSLTQAIHFGGTNINALQLDMVWPKCEDIRRAVFASGKRHRIEVILQVDKRSLDECNNNPSEVVSRLEKYKGVIHRVLLDKSMGRGLGMDAAALIPFAKAIKDRFPDLGLVVAGGLGPDSIGLVKPLVKVFPDISIDAQGKLRPSGSALDPIDWDMAGAYLVKALEILK